jgi:dolichol-phosphate mannosyltransferase
MSKSITFVFPCFNEEKNVTAIYNKISELKQHKKINYTFKYIFVDDGSVDNTWSEIKALSKKPGVSGVKLSKNFGHQYALTAGLKNTKSDAVIFMDSDLQHPVSKVPLMLKMWEQGFDVVNMIRVKTDSEPLLKKFLSKNFYKIVNLLSDTKIVAGACDFKLLDKKVLVEINKVDDYNRFIRGIVSWVGFNQCFLKFKANKRMHGKTGYTFFKNIPMAKIGLLSFSIKPLSLISFFGLFLTLVSTLLLIFGLIRSVIIKASYFSPIFNLVLANTLLIGVVLMCLGIVGIYVSFVYQEVTNRPKYIISETT